MTRLALLAVSDPRARQSLGDQLRQLGFEVRSTGAVATLWLWAERGEGDVVLLKPPLPDGDPVALASQLTRLRRELTVLLIGTAETRAPLPAGIVTVPNASLAALRAALVEKEPEQGAGLVDTAPPIGLSPAMRQIETYLPRVARLRSPVLISGPLGVGKERFARYLCHFMGPDDSRAMASINLTGLATDQHLALLDGSEASAWRQAAGRPLLMREIGRLSRAAQDRLVQLLQSPDRWGPSRLITTTSENLEAAVADRRFSEELRLMISESIILVPGLTDRREDIPALIRHFGSEPFDSLPALRLSEDAMAVLIDHDWPGNVRELRDVCRRLRQRLGDATASADTIRRELHPHVALGDTTGLRAQAARGGLSDSVGQHLETYFDAHGDELPPPGLYHRILAEIERPLLTRALLATRGNQLRAADLLGINRNTLRKKIRDLGLTVGRGAGEPD